MPNKNKISAWWLIPAFLALILIIGGIIGQTKKELPSPQIASQSSICDSDQLVLAQQAKKVDYNQLIKDPQSFAGTIAKFTGKVFQIEQSGNDGFIRLGVTEDINGNWDFNDVIYVTYHKSTPAVKGDIVTITGKIIGAVTYTSQANYQITIPGIDVCSVQVGKVK